MRQLRKEQTSGGLLYSAAVQSSFMLSSSPTNCLHIVYRPAETQAMYVPMLVRPKLLRCSYMWTVTIRENATSSLRNIEAPVILAFELWRPGTLLTDQRQMLL